MVGAYIENKSSALADLSMNGKGASMEDQLKALKDFQAELLANQPQIEEAEGANQVCESVCVCGCGCGCGCVEGYICLLRCQMFIQRCVFFCPFAFRQLKVH